MGDFFLEPRACRGESSAANTREKDRDAIGPRIANATEPTGTHTSRPYPGAGVVATWTCLVHYFG
jgi:hypothetical protein